MYNVKFFFKGKKYSIRLVNFGEAEIARFGRICRENGIIDGQIYDVTIDDGRTVYRGATCLNKHGTLVGIGRSLM